MNVHFLRRGRGFFGRPMAGPSPLPTDGTIDLNALALAFNEYHAEQGKLATQVAGIADTLKEFDAHNVNLEKRLNAVNVMGLAGDGEGGAKLAAERKAIGLFARTNDLTEIKASMSVGSDPGGGYTVLPQVSQGMTKRLFDLSPIRRLARIVPIDKGDSWEEIIDQDQPDAEWVGETQTRGATESPDMGKLSVVLHELRAGPKVTQKLLETSDINIGAWLEEKISDKFGRTEGAAFVNGNGVGKPRGYLQYDTTTDADLTRADGKLQHVKTGHASSFAATNPADVLIEMVYKLRAPYKQGGNVAWTMNSTTAMTVRKFKNGTGDYLWSDSLVKGAPPMLLGFPVELDEEMPNLGAGNYPIALANWQLGYVIVDMPGLKMLRDPFSSKPYVIFETWKRVGGGVANFDAIKLLKCEA